MASASRPASCRASGVGGSQTTGPASSRSRSRNRSEPSTQPPNASRNGEGGGFLSPYAQLKGSWSSMKNGKPLFHHVLQCVSCWKKELPDGDCRQGRRDYTKCSGTRSRGTWAGD